MAKLRLSGTVHEVARVDGREAGIRIGDRTVRADFRAIGDGAAEVTIDGRAHRVRVASAGGLVWVHAGGRAWTVEPLEPAEAAARAHASSDTLLAAMPGTVIAVAAEPGAAVAAGETIMVIESMKLETTVAAPRDGVVAEIGFGVGAAFDKGAVLARLAPEEAAGG
jgi:3-methylcrotonyl-CoA carboxylase alpha subunit